MYYIHRSNCKYVNIINYNHNNNNNTTNNTTLNHHHNHTLTPCHSNISINFIIDNDIYNNINFLDINANNAKCVSYEKSSK